MKNIFVFIIIGFFAFGLISSPMVFGGNIDSPRKQMAMGTAPEDVLCKEGFDLMLRSSGSAACVKPSTAMKLENSGWGTITKTAAMMAEKMMDDSMEDKMMDDSMEDKMMDDSMEDKMMDDSMEDKMMDDSMEDKMMDDSMEDKMMDDSMEDKMMDDSMEDKMMDDAMEDETEDAMETMTVAGIDVSLSAPLEGSPDAPITIIEFGDFQCPKCNIWFQGEKPIIVENYVDTGIVKVYFVDYSWLGDDSTSAAQAAHCAGDQEMYWDYHTHLYNNQGGINDGWASPYNLKAFANEMGLDLVIFDECLDSGKYGDRISHNTSVGESHDVEGTPTFFIVGPDGTVERINGPQPVSVFDKVIESFS